MKSGATLKDLTKQQLYLSENSDFLGGELLTLKNQKVIIGRSPQADIIIDHPSVSYYHAMAIVQDGALFIMDLKSHQGLIVNDQYVEEATLFEGDCLRIGELSFDFGIQEVAEQIINNRDQETQALTPHIKPQKNIIPPPQGLVLIDDEYCDITFDDHQFDPTSVDQPLLMPIGMQEHYIDPLINDDDEEVTFEEVARAVSHDSICMTTLINGIITSIDYIPMARAKILISGRYAKAGTLFIPGLNQEISVPLLTIDGSNVQVTTPQGFESPYDEAAFSLGKDTIYLTKGTLQIALERTLAPPKMKRTSFFNLERDFMKEAGKVFALFFIFMIGLLVVDTNIPEPPKKIAIIYKRAQKLKKKSKKTTTANPDKTDTNTGIKKEVTPIKELELAKKTTPKKSKKKPKKSKAAPKKKMVAKKAPSKPKKSPVKAYKFNKSKLQNFMASSSNFKANAAAKNSKSASATSTFSAVSANTSADSNALSADAPTRLGRDSRGAGKRSSGTKGLSSKSGFNTIESGPRTVVLGSIDPELLRKILQEYIPQFRYCYQQELKVNEAAEGVIDLAFRINANGPISNIKVTGKKAKFSRGGTACMAKVLKIIKFPTPKGGGVVDIKQPLNFVSEKGSY
jgi:outer membrane biosynthesis protein TonB